MEHVEEKAQFGELLRHYRLRAGLSQTVLAAAAGTNQGTVSKAEGGEVTEWMARRLIDAISAHAAGGDLAITRGGLEKLATAFLFPNRALPEDQPSKTIGVIITAVEGSAFWGKIIGAAERVAAEAGYLLVVRQHFNSLQQQRACIERFAEGAPPAGLLIAPAYGIMKTSGGFQFDVIEQLQPLHRLGIPIVLLDRKPPGNVPFPCVKADHARLMRAAVEELYRRGHRRIGAVFGARHSPAYQEQYRGFLEALDTLGLFPDDRARSEWTERWVAYGADFPLDNRETQRQRRGHTSGRDVASQLLRQSGDHPTALVCGTAVLAMETLVALRILRQEGLSLSVPEDLSIIAAEPAPILDWGVPPIVCVDYGLGILAERAIRKMLTLIEEPGNKAEQRDDLIQTFLIGDGQSVRTLSDRGL